MNIPRLIGITGYAGIGKDTCADILVDKHGFRKKAFADPLKDKVAEWLREPKSVPSDVPICILALLEVVRDQYVNRVRDRIKGPFTYELWVREKPYSPELRKLLQFVGTEYYRAKDNYYWIKSFNIDPDYNWVVPDVRFQNEADLIWALGGIVIRVNREGYGGTDTHASEQVYNLDVDIDMWNPLGEQDKLEESLLVAIGKANRL